MIEDDGNVLLARQLDYETRKEYNLTIAVTDGVYTTATQLFVSVKDINEYRPKFSQDVYEVNVTENAEIGSLVVRLLATDDDQDLRLVFGIQSAQHVNSVKSFTVDYQSGIVSVQRPLDRWPKKNTLKKNIFFFHSSFFYGTLYATLWKKKDVFWRNSTVELTARNKKKNFPSFHFIHFESFRFVFAKALL